MPPSLVLFVATTFASAFLIFLVQPIVAKSILPWFGGVPAVWSLCLAFYQTTLFAGYAYAHALIARANPRTHLLLHGAVIAAAVLTVPVLPGDAWKPEVADDPTGLIFAMLLANVALPYFALAATGPLVAVWFSRRFPGRSPYPLYAVSNLGSLIALLAYPFAIEPRLPLSTTGNAWSYAFGVTGIAVIACAALAWRGDGAGDAAVSSDADGSEATPARVVLWVLLSACAVVLLMGITNHLCLDLASIPFLWILPLAIYLATLILCFASPRAYRPVPFLLLALFAYFAPELGQRFDVAGRAFVFVFDRALTFQIVRDATLLFGACMVLHGELYRLRPPTRSLTAYYLCTSGGGALGGLAVGLVAPRVFSGFYELPIGLSFACALALWTWRIDARGWLGRSTPAWRFAAIAALVALVIGYRGSQLFARPAVVLHRERSFFGVLQVERVVPEEYRPTYQSLVHGSTVHGLQISNAPEQPTSYFGMHTGIEIVFGLRDPGTPVEIGVIGLGIGTLAAYGRPGDHFRFFEIDPAVIRLARDSGYFTFVAQSRARVDLIEGDGRIAVARERERDAPLFDYLIVDAYSSDAVPVHLLTREALALYVSSLAPNGILGIHISSRFFELTPMLFRLAEDAGLSAVQLQNEAAPRFFSYASRWVFMAKGDERLKELALAAEERQRSRNLLGNRPPPVIWPTPGIVEDAPLWTDDYSNLFMVLN